MSEKRGEEGKRGGDGKEENRAWLEVELHELLDCLLAHVWYQRVGALSSLSGWPFGGKWKDRRPSRGWGHVKSKKGLGGGRPCG